MHLLTEIEQKLNWLNGIKDFIKLLEGCRKLSLRNSDEDLKKNDNLYYLINSTFADIDKYFYGSSERMK